MAVEVVDRLEAIQIEITDRQRLAAALGLRHRQLHAVAEQHAVGQLRQGIEVGQMFQALLVFLDQGNVGEDADEMRDLALAVAYRRDGELFDKNLAGFLAVPDFALPVARFLDGLPHLKIKLGRVVPGFEQFSCLADGFFSRVAGQFAECVIDFDDPPSWVGNHDAFVGMVENAGGKFCRSSASRRSLMSWEMPRMAGWPLRSPEQPGFQRPVGCRQRAKWARRS